MSERGLRRTARPARGGATPDQRLPDMAGTLHDTSRLPVVRGECRACDDGSAPDRPPAQASQGLRAHPIGHRETRRRIMWE